MVLMQKNICNFLKTRTKVMSILEKINKIESANFNNKEKFDINLLHEKLKEKEQYKKVSKLMSDSQEDNCEFEKVSDFLKVIFSFVSQNQQVYSFNDLDLIVDAAFQAMFENNVITSKL